MCQEYQLEDTLTHKRYSLDNQPFFGKESSFAVLVEDGVVTSQTTAMPWLSDSNFVQYKNSKYRPILSRTSLMTSVDSTWRETGVLSSDAMQKLSDSTWVFVQDTVLNKGFIRDSLINGSDGWLVWLASEDGSDLSLITYRYTASEQETLLIDAPKTDGVVYGGIFIVPSYEQVGRIDLKLCGILTPSVDKWLMTSVLPRMVDGKDTPNGDKQPTLTPLDSDDNQPDEVVADKETGKKGNKKNKK